MLQQRWKKPSLWKIKFSFFIVSKRKIFIFKNTTENCWKNIYLANQFLFSFLLCHLRFNVLHFSWHFIGATMAAFVSHFPFSQIVIESGAHFMFLLASFFFLCWLFTLEVYIICFSFSLMENVGVWEVLSWEIFLLFCCLWFYYFIWLKAEYFIR